ncbi:unnamed protein product [Durusdinium trenchii]|uniref:AAA+ ATPase domain-containing protein n=1 Tax=Durusdinium trenchii TaxID=1381693 RepID=A0ABP0KST0_9DINO
MLDFAAKRKAPGAGQEWMKKPKPRRENSRQTQKLPVYPRDLDSEDSTTLSKPRTPDRDAYGDARRRSRSHGRRRDSPQRERRRTSRVSQPYEKHTEQQKPVRRLSERDREAAYAAFLKKNMDRVAPPAAPRVAPPAPKASKKKRAKAKVEDRAKAYSKSTPPQDFDDVAQKLSGRSLPELMSRGLFASLTKLCYAVKPLAPLPHHGLLATLLKLPHFVRMSDLDPALHAMLSSTVWTTPQARDYFRHLLWPIMDTFIEESKEAIKRRMVDRPLLNESFLGLIFTEGVKPGELKLKQESLPWNSEGRPLDDSDSVWLTLMNEKPGTFCECSIVNMNPLVLCGDEKNPIFRSVRAGEPARIDKLAPRTTFVRTLCALHCLTEPDRPGGKKQKKEDAQVIDRLPSKFAPSLMLKKLLMPFGPTDEDRYWWAQEEPHLLKDGALDVDPSRTLNDSQLKALESAAENTLTLIQGPPGTGKTTTCVQILRRWAMTFKRPNKSCRILATSGSNIAVDNLVEGLLKENVKVVRIGRPESTRPELAASAVENVAAKMLGVSSLAEVPSFHQRRQALHQAILEAQVVCCTAVTAGGGLLRDIYFPLVLIDEASQATEPATLVPICHGCKQLVLCGDHCQLPPTVKSEKEHSEVLKMSLFERLALTGVKPVMLNVQYRMHPLLSAFPSQAFYEGKLLDAIMQTPVEKPPSWKYKHNLVVVPVFDQESPKGTSHMNEGEAEVLVKHLEDYLENGGSEESIGVISPYDSQVKLLRRMLKSRHIKTGLQGVEVNSVDGFQGREKEVIMISTVRSNEQNTTGFVRDWRRVNVAMTRAKPFGMLYWLCATHAHWHEISTLGPLAIELLDLEIRPRDDRMSFAARLALGFCLWQCLWHFQLSMSYTVPPALLELLARRSRSPVLYFAGSFNPAHAGHLEAINEAKRQVAKKHREAPIVLVAPKSDERLAEKMKAAGSFLFPYAERVKLFQSLLRCNGAHDVVFDGHWRHFTGDAREIRVATDRAFEALGCEVFRVMGEDRVKDHGLEDDPFVLPSVRANSMSSTEIRRLLVEDAQASCQ